MKQMNPRMIQIVLLATASALYRHELSHLPEKLRQERIQKTVFYTVARIQERVIDAASNNRTDFQFPLFCIEPNIAHAALAHSGISLYKPSGDKYVFSVESTESFEPILPRPRCEQKYGYQLYQEWKPHVFQESMETTRLYALLQALSPIQPLEDLPTIYLQRFFELFNQAFPDIRLEVSSYRPSRGIFDTECCPVYNVSW